MDNMFCAAEISCNLLPLKNIDHIYEVVNKMEMRAIYSSSLQAICWSNGMGLDEAEMALPIKVTMHQGI